MRKPFVLDSASQRSRMKEYQPLEDVHLYNFFGSPVVRKTLRKGGLVTNKGEVIQHTYNPRAPKIILPPLAFVAIQPKTAGAFTFGHTKQTASSGRLGSKPEIPDRTEEIDKVKTLDRKSGSTSDLSKPRESRKRATAGETAKKRSWESSSLKPLSHEEYETMLQRFVIPEEGAQQVKAAKKASSSAIASPSRRDDKERGAQVMDRPRAEEVKKKPQEEQRIEKPVEKKEPVAKVEPKPAQPGTKPAENSQPKVEKPKNVPKPAEAKPKVESPRTDVKKPVGSPKAAPAQPEKPAEQLDSRPKESQKAASAAPPQAPEEHKREVPKTEVQKAEVPKAEVPKAEVPKAEVLKAELSKAEEPKIEKAAEVPKEESKAEVLKAAEVPREEAPKAELPKVEEEKAEAKAKSPRAEVPKVEAPIHPAVEKAEQAAPPDAAEHGPKAGHEGTADLVKESEPAKATPPEELKPSTDIPQMPEAAKKEELKPAIEPPSEDPKPAAEPLDSQVEPPVYNAEVPVLQAAPPQPSEA